VRTHIEEVRTVAAVERGFGTRAEAGRGAVAALVLERQLVGEPTALAREAIRTLFKVLPAPA
jgi:hypothetical protein